MTCRPVRAAVQNHGFFVGEGDLIDQGLFAGGWSRRSGGEKLYGDFDQAGL